MTSSMLRNALAGLCCLVGAGCALTSKADPVEFRYFTPEAIAAPEDPPHPTAGSDGKTLELRLGVVNAAAYIRDRIAFRDAGHELGFYDELRWSEKPEAYLRRAVARTLFETRGVRELVAKPGPTLEIDLASFEERRAPAHVAHVEVTWSLRDEQAVIMQRTFAVDSPVGEVKAGKLPDAIAGAMMVALREAVNAIVDGTLTELARTEAQPPPTAQSQLH